jgi:uncharacterized RDD family membrane protein YckC
MFRSCYAGPDQGGPRLTDTLQIMQPAPLVRRFGALLIDWIGCVLISGLFARPLTQGWAPVLVLIAEYGFFLGLLGVTPGMYVLGLRCVRTSDGGPLGIGKALLRGVLLALVVPALIMDEQRRGVHDRAAGSIVILATPRRG